MALIEHLRYTFPPLDKLLKDNKDNGWAPGQGFQKGELIQFLSYMGKNGYLLE